MTQRTRKGAKEEDRTETISSNIAHVRLVPNADQNPRLVIIQRVIGWRVASSCTSSPVREEFAVRSIALVGILFVFFLASPLSPGSVETAGAAPAAAEPVAVPEPSPEAVSYYNSGNALWLVSTVWGLLFPALLLFTGWSSRLRDLAHRIGRKWFFVVAVYFVLYSAISYLVWLPMEYYQDYLRERAYGLSNQNFEGWLTDSVISFAVNTVLGALLLWIPYLLLKRSPRRWWLYTGVVAVPVIFLVLMITPVVIVPLFNEVTPMQDAELEKKILDVAERAGIDDAAIMQINSSADSRTLNAAVMGFGGTKRIVVTDTLVQKLDEDELLFGIAHESGHYVLGHTVYTVLFLSVLIVATLFVAHVASGKLIARFQGRFRFNELGDIASLPLILLLSGVISLSLTPVWYGFTRSNEHEADRFALELTRANRAGATSFVKLQNENLRIPRPGLLFVLWRASHPSLGDRIDFCNNYRPWETGEPSRYDRVIRRPAEPAARVGAAATPSNR